MKIPFDIKYRPQIESGEYKVETRDGRPARVICWDRVAIEPLDNCNIVALVTGLKSKSESTYYYYQDGHLWNKANDEGDSVLDLFIITPEQKLTEFEKELERFYNCYLQVCSPNSHLTIEDSLHNWASRLLELAKKELCKGCAANLEGYNKGRQDALKEMEEKRVYKYEGPTIPTYWPPCYHGGPCTNPMHDCINCPRQSSIGINTTTGTSTAKVEG